LNFFIEASQEIFYCDAEADNDWTRF